MIAAAKQQLAGVVGQVIFAAPVFVTSVALSRLESVELVAELAFAFGIANLVATALSFGLRSHLGLWGFREFPERTFVANRAYASIAGALLSYSLLYVLGISQFIIIAATLIKLADSIADLQFALSLARADVGYALNRLAIWSLTRLTVFCAAYGVAIFSMPAHSEALILASCAQALFAVLPWAREALKAVTTSSRTSALSLARVSLAMSLAAISSGLLTTLPRLAIDTAYASVERGYAGITLIIGTFFGMAFNTLWIRASVTYQQHGIGITIRRFVIEGLAVSAFLMIALVATKSLIASIYAVNHETFDSIYMPLAIALIAFFFVMSSTNFLKAVRMPVHEATIHILAAATFWAAAVSTRSMVTALHVSSGILLIAVVVLLRRRCE